MSLSPNNDLHVPITRQKIRLPSDVKSSALYSKDRRHRYFLEREWGDDGLVVNWILLNPSSATELTNDRTNVKTLNWTRQWDFGKGRPATKMIVTNLFSFRATSPVVMQSYYSELTRNQLTRIQAANVYHLLQTAYNSNIIICAWGGGGSFLGEDDFVKRQLSNLIERTTPIMCLSLNKDGSPTHPLYHRIDDFKKTIPFIIRK